MMTYPEVIEYLNSFIDYEKTAGYSYKQSFKLERIKHFLEIVENPQEDIKCVHIAGTKGKGSTCAFIAYILREAGFRVGLYTSPHLSDFRERIRILNPGDKNSTDEFEGMISHEELSVLIERLKPEIERYNSQSKYGILSFFEVYTALAFIYFREKGIDFAVLETGLGGRLDATNVVNPLLAVITSINYEHTRQLGNTLTEIASEKVGIIKSGGSQGSSVGFGHVVATAPQAQEVMEIIRNRCLRQNAILYEIGRDIMFQRRQLRHDYQSFDIDGVLGRINDLKIRLLGEHQLINATLAVTAISVLNKYYGIDFNLKVIRDGLFNTKWPGRFEIIMGEPMFILDGAQNHASAQSLRKTLTETFPEKGIVLVLGVSRDKDIMRIVQLLVPLSKEVILTQADNPRAADIEDIEDIIRRHLEEIPQQIFKFRDSRSAVELARQKARPQDLILVTGSLFLVGEVRTLLKNN